MRPKRIDQITPYISRHDAIGNHIRAIQELIRGKGYESDIFAVDGEPGLSFSKAEDLLKQDSLDHIVIHHFSVGSIIPGLLIHAKAFRVLDYHNITPPPFFLDQGEWQAFASCLQGYQQMPLVKLSSDFLWSDSSFNADELERYGFDRARVLPIIRHYSHLAKSSLESDIDTRITKDKKTILFVGRVVPNKAQHDLIFALAQYKKHINPAVRLVLIGGQSPAYFEKLKELCRLENLTYSQNPSDPKLGDYDVLFLGGLNDQQMSAYYRMADAFVCLSEHEGFGVPLVEAMFFDLPIVVHRSTAVPETAGSGALMVDKSNIVELMQGLNTILENKEAAQFWRQRAKERSKDFTYDKLVSRFDEVLEETLQVFQKRSR